MRSNQSARASPDIWEAEAFSGVGGAADQTPLRWGVAPRPDRVQRVSCLKLHSGLPHRAFDGSAVAGQHLTRRRHHTCPYRLRQQTPRVGCLPSPPWPLAKARDGGSSLQDRQRLVRP